MITKMEAYLGDGVYVKYDDSGMLRLSVQGNADGPYPQSVYLEPEVWRNLVEFAKITIDRPKGE